MKIGAIGSRTFLDEKLASVWLSKFVVDEFDVIVSGGAPGADTICANWGLKNGFQVKEYKPDWEKYGKKAGFLRNKQIIDDSDVILCFWDGESKGSQHSLNLAKKAKKPTIIIYF